MTHHEMIERAKSGRMSALQSLKAREGNLLYLAHFRGDKRKARTLPFFMSSRTETQPTAPTPIVRPTRVKPTRITRRAA
jgi:hypothetical protein